MVIIIKPKDNVLEIRKSIDEFLSKRGMNVSKKKTKLTAAINGFDFLGWHFKVLPDKRYYSSPSKQSYVKIKKKIRTVIKNATIGAQEKCKLLAPIIRGFNGEMITKTATDQNITSGRLNILHGKPLLNKNRSTDIRYPNLSTRPFQLENFI